MASTQVNITQCGWLELGRLLLIWEMRALVLVVFVGIRVEVKLSYQKRKKSVNYRLKVPCFV